MFTVLNITIMDKIFEINREKKKQSLASILDFNLLAAQQDSHMILNK